MILKQTGDRYLDNRRAVSTVEYFLGHLNERKGHLNGLFDQWNRFYQDVDENLDNEYWKFVDGTREVGVARINLSTDIMRLTLMRATTS